MVIEKDEDGFFIGTVPELKGCHSQAQSIDELIERMREAVQLCIDVEGKDGGELEFIGIQRIAV